MPFNGLNLAPSRETPIAVHDESYVLGNRALPQCTDEQFTKVVYGPFDRRR
jgi:hypothetical protein